MVTREIEPPDCSIDVSFGVGISVPVLEFDA
jgi:hypothetical protein